MLSKDFIKQLAEEYGIGYSEVETGNGGSIIDDTGIRRDDVSFKTVKEVFGGGLNKYFVNADILIAA